MPTQPGCSMFALDNRPKQKRQRRKNFAPGALNSMKTNETQRPGQSSRSLRQATDNEYPASGTSSALASSGVGPIRSSRGKRARKQDEGILGIGTHYDNWMEDRHSPVSTEGTAPKTPQSWGSPASTISPPGRRNAVSEGPFSAANIVAPESFVLSAASESQNTSSIQTVHGRSHGLDEYPELQAFANHDDVLTGQQPVLQQNYNHSLIPSLDIPYSTGLAAHAFGQPSVSVVHSANVSNSFWAGTLPAVNSAQHSLQQHHSQAAECFPSSHLFDPVATPPFDGLPYPSELDPLLFSRTEHRVPGAYPSPPGIDTCVFVQEIPGVHAQDLNHDVPTMMQAHGRSSSSYHGNYMHFPPPHE